MCDPTGGGASAASFAPARLPYPAGCDSYDRGLVVNLIDDPRRLVLPGALAYF